MENEKILQLIRNEIKQWEHDNYVSGDSRTAPHQHDGIDNLQISPVDFLGYQIFLVASASVEPTDTPINGTLRFQYDGTSLTMWVRNAPDWFQIGGGGGGSPGGADTNVQFNDAGSFGGQSTFAFDKTSVILTLDDGSETGFDGATLSGGNSGLQIRTNNQSGGIPGGQISISSGDDSASGGVGGDIYVNSGDSAVDGTPGSIFVSAGDCGDFVDSGLNDGGQIFITGGDTGEATGGTVNINSGGALNGGTSGNIQLLLGQGASGQRGHIRFRQFDGFGTIQPNIGIGSSVGFGGGQGVIYMRNRTTAPSSDPSSGGLLYIESGALMYRGSGGTVTTVAPA